MIPNLLGEEDDEEDDDGSGHPKKKQTKKRKQGDDKGKESHGDKARYVTPLEMKTRMVRLFKNEPKILSYIIGAFNHAATKASAEDQAGLFFYEVSKERQYSEYEVGF